MIQIVSSLMLSYPLLKVLELSWNTIYHIWLLPLTSC